MDCENGLLTIGAGKDLGSASLFVIAICGSEWSARRNSTRSNVAHGDLIHPTFMRFTHPIRPVCSTGCSLQKAREKTGETLGTALAAVVPGDGFWGRFSLVDPESAKNPRDGQHLLAR